MTETETPNKPITNGREPHLSSSFGEKGMRRLSLRGLATMLNVLPAHAISIQVSEEALRSDTFYVRYNAAKKLAQRGDREARLLMQKLLTDGEPPTRASVARHLYGFTWFSGEPLISASPARFRYARARGGHLRAVRPTRTERLSVDDPCIAKRGG